MNKEQLKRLSEAMKEFEPLLKNKSNPFTKSKYADLNALIDVVKEPLLKHGFLLLQPISDGLVKTTIIDIESAEVVLESSLELKEQKDPQKTGSEITYFRRYTLQSLLGIKAEDDDGNRSKPQTGRPKLSKSQFDKLLMPENYKYIKKAFDKYDMTPAQKAELSALIDEI